MRKLMFLVVTIAGLISANVASAYSPPDLPRIVDSNN